MRKVVRFLRRAVLPMAAFLSVVLIHFIWFSMFPEQDPAQNRWATVAVSVSPFARYVESQGYWLGYSYALSLSFAIVILRRYREGRLCTSRSMAIGGVTLPGFLTVAGCFLVGCCGSPMLVIYLNLFGAAFLPLAKPLIAVVTTASIALSWWWMNRFRPTNNDLITMDTLTKAKSNSQS